MGEVQWIKLYIDMFDKRKINKIRRLPAGNDILLFWVMLLATAGKCNAGGLIFITERVPFTKEDLSDEFDFEISTIELALKAFVELDMIDLSDEGFISVRNWEHYQNIDKLAEIREKDRERKRLKRAEAKALLGQSTDVHGNSTDCPHIEEEKEEDKEKEIHSFIHSCASEEEAYINRRIEEEGFEGEDAEVFREEIKDGLRQKYIGGTLGQGVVMMSDEQFGYICENYSLDEIEKYMGIIVDCERNGKHFKKKTHFQAFQEMAQKDRRVSK